MLQRGEEDVRDVLMMGVAREALCVTVGPNWHTAQRHLPGAYVIHTVVSRARVTRFLFYTFRA